MKLINEIFDKYEVITANLLAYGFTKENNKYIKKYDIHNSEFCLVITISENLNIKLYENEYNEEYALFYQDDNHGKFIIDLQKEVERILLDIRDKCYLKKQFKSKQANRIETYIQNKYGDMPSFLFDKFPEYGVFKDKKSNKWYALISNVKANKLSGKSDKICYIINLTLDEKTIQELITKDNIYPGYHMNKKHWISIVLDDKYDDDFINKYIDLSYEKVMNKKGH